VSHRLGTIGEPADLDAALASSGATAVAFQLNLNTETVKQVITLHPICLEPHTPVRDAFLRMKEQRRGAVLICRAGVLVGIFTERDAVTLMADEADLDVPIEQVMTENPVALSAHDTVATAIAAMSKGGYRRLPIVDTGGRPTGFLQVNSILHFLVDHFPATVYNLPPTPHHTTQSREGA
jgi:CBS domain-containing protein